MSSCRRPTYAWKHALLLRPGRESTPLLHTLLRGVANSVSCDAFSGQPKSTVALFTFTRFRHFRCTKHRSSRLPGAKVRRRARHDLVRVDRSETLEHAAGTMSNRRLARARGAREPEVHVNDLQSEKGEVRIILVYSLGFSMEQTCNEVTPCLLKSPGGCN